MSVKAKGASNAAFNTLAVFDAWCRSAYHRKTNACWTNGIAIYSYDTVIAVEAGGVIVLNRTPYTKYTDPYQTELQKLILDAGMPLVEIAGVPVDTAHLCAECGMLYKEVARHNVASVTLPVVEAPKVKRDTEVYKFNPQVGF